ncbi:hypothetical protein E2C01_071577 [Portunus trituberculatus]|uniref:Uncharacterized protein n=1 Tax=Portunus trituberculatus TaxID=210409 RepID=A0A5B7I0A6_PORTR|nr:hypothetical protein [Portunus trituberculatus]
MVTRDENLHPLHFARFAVKMSVAENLRLPCEASRRLARHGLKPVVPRVAEDEWGHSEVLLPSRPGQQKE